MVNSTVFFSNSVITFMIRLCKNREIGKQKCIIEIWMVPSMTKNSHTHIYIGS
jgi:hypothetical protein